MNSLILYEPRVLQERSCLVEAPEPHGLVSARCNQDLGLLYILHVQNTARMPNYCLEALVVRLDILWLPEFNSSIR